MDRREWFKVIGAIALATELSNCSRQKYPIAEQISLQSSYRGPIKSLYTFTFDREDRVDEIRQLSDFFGVPVNVIAEKGTNPREYPPNSFVLHVDLVIHKWIRDLFLVSDSQVMISPTYFLRSRNRNQFALGKQTSQSLDLIVEKEGLEPSTCPFVFQGGEVLKDDNYVFLPEHFNDVRIFYPYFLYDRYGSLSGVPPESAFNALFGNIKFIPVLSDSGTTAFGSHLDTFFMPASPGKVLIADPYMAIDCIQRMDKVERERFELEAQRYHGRVASLRFLDDQSMAPEIFKVHENIRKALLQNFELIGVPFPILYDPSTGIMNSGIVMDYVNSLLDFDSRKAAFPIYGSKTLDKLAVDSYRMAGYEKLLEVNLIRAISERAGIRCKYLEVREAK